VRGEQRTVLGLRCTNDIFPWVLVRCVERQAELVQSSLAGTSSAARHASAAAALARYVSGLSPTDPRLWALWMANMQTSPNSDEYGPGERQRTVLGTMGVRGPVSDDPSDLLDELVAAALGDVIVAGEGRHMAAHERAQAQELVRVRRKLDQGQAAEVELERLREQFARSEEKNKHLAEVNEYLRGHVVAEGRPEVVHQSEADDWRAVPGHPGVYAKRSREGVYKVGWLDAQGKQRWDTGRRPETVEEADARRAAKAAGAEAAA